MSDPVYLLALAMWTLLGAALFAMLIVVFVSERRVAHKLSVHPAWLRAWTLEYQRTGRMPEPLREAITAARSRDHD